MKKLLATLLVVAMLISCMSIVAFADGNTATTIAQFPFDGMGAFDGSAWEYSNAITKIYYTKADATSTGKALGWLKNNTAIFGALKAGEDNGTDAVIPTTLGAGEYVMVPLIVENVIAYDINVYYDNTKFQYTGCADIFGVTAKDEGAYVHVVGFNSADYTGVMAGVFFKLLADGIENGEFTLVVNNTTKGNGNVDVTQVNPTKMVVNKTAAAKPATVTEDSDTTAGAVTVSDAVELADIDAFTASAGDDTTWLATNAAKVTSGDGKEVSLYDSPATYGVYFGKNDFSGVGTPPDKVGLALYRDGELVDLFVAKNIVENKWGILFFGLDSTKTYTTKQFVFYGEESVKPTKDNSIIAD